MCIKKALLFEPPHKKLRKMNKYELETERLCATAFKRPPVSMWGEIPYWPWLKTEPLVNQLPKVNFDLNFKP